MFPVLGVAGTWVSVFKAVLPHSVDGTCIIAYMSFHCSCSWPWHWNSKHIAKCCLAGMLDAWSCHSFGVGSRLCCPYIQILHFPSPADKQESGGVKAFHFCSSCCLGSPGLSKALSGAGDRLPENEQIRAWVISPHQEALLHIILAIICLSLEQSHCCVNSLKSPGWWHAAHATLWLNEWE